MKNNIMSTQQDDSKFEEYVHQMKIKINCFEAWKKKIQKENDTKHDITKSIIRTNTTAL